MGQRDERCPKFANAHQAKSPIMKVNHCTEEATGLLPEPWTDHPMPAGGQHEALTPFAALALSQALSSPERFLGHNAQDSEDHPSKIIHCNYRH